MNDPTGDAPPVAALDVVAAYQNEDVIGRFVRTYDVTCGEAEELFREVKKFLWLCGVMRLEAPVTMEPVMLMLDEMWHTFLLFSSSYREFCERYCGGLIDHDPAPESERAQSKALAEGGDQGYRTSRERELNELVALVFDRLGEETAILWFEGLGERYPVDRLRSIRRPLV